MDKSFAKMCIELELSSAFDIVDHQILFEIFAQKFCFENCGVTVYGKLEDKPIQLKLIYLFCAVFRIRLDPAVDASLNKFRPGVSVSFMKLN